MKTIAIFIFMLTFSVPAHAYLDPGSGSAIVSAIIGIVVAVGMSIKTYWYKIKSFFFGQRRCDDEKKEKP